MMGGAMYALERGLKWKKFGKVMAVLFALFAMLAAVRGGRVDAVMLTRLSRFSYHRLALYLILCFLQDHGVGLITTEYELRYILYLRGFERTLLDRAQENGCNALWAEGE